MTLIRYAAPGLILMCTACGGGSGAPDTAGRDGAVADGARDSAPGEDARGDTRPADATTDGRMAMDGGAPSDGSADADADADAPLPVCEAQEDLGSAEGVNLATGSTVGGSNTLVPGCVVSPSTAPEAIFRWRAPRDGRWVFDTLGSSFDTILHVRDASCREIACQDDGTFGGRQSRLELELTAGTEVFVVVDGALAARGDYALSIGEAALAETDCQDGVDNDRDGAADCRDSDCRPADPAHCIETDCQDGLDNDGDETVDCGDNDCWPLEPCVERTCGDGLDNDGNGAVDCADANCAELSPCSEVACGDGVDNDGDGDTDCADGNCACSLDCVPDRCPDGDLGSALGSALVRGSTVGVCDQRQPAAASGCDGAILGLGIGGDVTYRWRAPATGSYTFSTLGSDYDTMLYLLDGSCAGPILACANDQIGFLTTLTISLTGGQDVIVVLDGHGFLGEQSGNYVLSIFGE